MSDLVKARQRLSAKLSEANMELKEYNVDVDEDGDQIVLVSILVPASELRRRSEIELDEKFDEILEGLEE